MERMGRMGKNSRGEGGLEWDEKNGKNGKNAKDLQGGAEWDVNIIGIIGIYLFGLRTGSAIKLHKKGRDFRMREKKRKGKNRNKNGGGGDITTGRTNRSHSGFYSHQGARPTSTSPHSQSFTRKKLHNCKKAAN